MGHKTLIYKQKIIDNLKECNKHLLRLENAFEILNNKYQFPLNNNNFKNIINNIEYLAYSDQIIYRFSKLQDSMEAKLFKAVLFYHGENINKPFLDILNQLESINIVNVDDWFEIRDLRNEIAHDYDDNDEIAMNILNKIYKLKNDLKNILDSISKLVS